MKKLFAILAVAALFAACGEEPNTGGNTQKPDVNIDPDFVSAITIDGNYADWDALTENVQVATLPEGECRYSQLKTFKLHADEYFIHIYCEFDPTNTLVFVPYFDLDNDATTGTTSKWNGGGYEAKAEGDIWEWSMDANEEPVAQVAPKAWDPAFYYYNPETGDTDEICASGIGAVESSLPALTANGTYAFEAAIIRELIAAYGLGDAITVGMIQYDMNWSYIGMLPCQNEEARLAGALEEMLTVSLPEPK